MNSTKQLLMLPTSTQYPCFYPGIQLPTELYSNTSALYCYVAAACHHTVVGSLFFLNSKQYFFVSTT